MTERHDGVFILGVGMTSFLKPRAENDYAELGLEAGIKALLDAGITYDDVDRGIASYCYGDSVCGQRVFYQFGMTGIPIYNVNNNCASGSTAIALARDFIKTGLSDCVMAVGFEKMARGSLGSNFEDRTNPLDKFLDLMKRNPRTTNPMIPFAPQLFSNAAEEYMARFGATKEDLAEVARIHHEHSSRNPYSQFRDVYTHQDIMESPAVCGPLTKLQCCPTSDGGAAAVLVSWTFLEAHPDLKARAVEILGQSLRTDQPAAFERSALDLVGFDMIRSTAQDAYKEAGVTSKKVKVAEVHDCFSSNMLICIDATGLAPHGKAHEHVRHGQTTYGTKGAVVCPSGGLISKGHPLGATGIAQCAELVWHLRGWANNRLVDIAADEVALQQNVGIGGACIVTILQRADKMANQKVSNDEIAVLSGVGYNPAVMAQGITRAQITRAQSQKHPSVWASRCSPNQRVAAANL